MGPWMIYGANGYTGELAARKAAGDGLKPILAGRRAEAIEPLGRELGLQTRLFDLNDRAAADAALAGVTLVLNCAGPFSLTVGPMLDACARAKAHYLDITGEIGVFEYVHNNAEKWRAAGIVAMPGVGFDVVPSDCLAAMLKRELPTANHLRLAFKSVGGRLSPGTTKTMLQGAPDGGKIRRDGKIVAVPPAYKVENIDFGEGPATAVTIPWGDVSTAYQTTGIPNIEVFMGAHPKQIKAMKQPLILRKLMGIGFVQNILMKQVAKRVKGPTAEMREKGYTLLCGEAWDENGGRVEMRIRTPEGYKLTVITALMAAKRVLESPPAPGAWTPAKAFGPEFIMEVPGVTVTKV